MQKAPDTHPEGNQGLPQPRHALSMQDTQHIEEQGKRSHHPKSHCSTQVQPWPPGTAAC